MSSHREIVAQLKAEAQRDDGTSDEAILRREFARYKLAVGDAKEHFGEWDALDPVVWAILRVVQAQNDLREPSICTLPKATWPKGPSKPLSQSAARRLGLCKGQSKKRRAVLNGSRDQFQAIKPPVGNARTTNRRGRAAMLETDAPMRIDAVQVIHHTGQHESNTDKIERVLKELIAPPRTGRPKPPSFSPTRNQRENLFSWFSQTRL